MKLNAEERAILTKLSREQLVFLSNLSEEANFSTFIIIVNLLADFEKSKFFGEREVNNETIAIDHAYSRGTIGGNARLLRIIEGAKAELERRKPK